MSSVPGSNPGARPGFARQLAMPFAIALLGAAACAPSVTTTTPAAPVGTAVTDDRAPDAPMPDPRVGLGAGLTDAEEAIWNLRVLSQTQPPEAFIGVTNSDLAFTGPYAIQGNYNGFIVWDISNPNAPTLEEGHVCPASQSDVSVYRNLLFVSGEAYGGRTDCGTQGVQDTVSDVRLRGIRIFDITDINNPEYIANVQTCRGSHTHTVLKDPNDDENVYVYVSGSAPVRPAAELPGCVAAPPSEDPNSALFRIEVIRVPLANPEQAAIVSSPRIFQDLVAPPRHGDSPADSVAAERAAEEAARQRAAGAFAVEIQGSVQIPPDAFVDARLDSIVEARGGTGAPTAADSATLRQNLQGMIDRLVEAQMAAQAARGEGPRPGPTQCHDITVYPAIGLAGGACEGYGLLLDISDPVNPRRIDAVADSNFSYWHSATFNNSGTKVLFSDEWGGGGGPKCRALDPREWGANAIFTIEDREMEFQTYYKLPAVQTEFENCVAHNGSLIPIPGRDVMVQAWYQGGISVFDWTDPENPYEIAFHDRGPSNATEMGPGGSWSVYWYNGKIVSSEIARGLDIFELVPSAHISQNEIDAARTVELDYLNAQGQPQFVWPPSFALARAYVDQLERWNGLSAERIASIRTALTNAENASGSARSSALTSLASTISGYAGTATDAPRVRMLADAVRDLAGA
ncbi:MAG TPA: hypothetical protein VHG09_03310 [Longimicrobiales bacterium]|nr:hypothetical protein [Longimicrobiales bacterium]